MHSFGADEGVTQRYRQTTCEKEMCGLKESVGGFRLLGEVAAGVCMGVCDCMRMRVCVNVCEKVQMCSYVCMLVVLFGAAVLPSFLFLRHGLVAQGHCTTRIDGVCICCICARE